MRCVIPIIGRLLAAGSPRTIKSIQAGLMLANSPLCITLPGRSVLGDLFNRPAGDIFNETTSFVSPAEETQAPLSAEEVSLRQLAETNRREALDILNAQDWKPVDSDGQDTFYIRRKDGRNVWKFKTVVDCSAKQFADELIYNCDNCPSWNKAVQKCKTHQKIADGIEIMQQETGSFCGGLVARREFINLRHRGCAGDMHYSAVASIDHSNFPRRNSCVRAENFPTVFTVRPCADAPARRCVVEGTLNYDVKLSLVPSRIIERSMHQVWRDLRSQMHDLARRVTSGR